MLCEAKACTCSKNIDRYDKMWNILHAKSQTTASLVYHTKIIKLTIKVQKQSHTSSAPALNHHSISLLTSVEYGREMPNVFAGVHGQKCLCQISVHVVGKQPQLIKHYTCLTASFSV